MGDLVPLSARIESLVELIALAEQRSPSATLSRLRRRTLAFNEPPGPPRGALERERAVTRAEAAWWVAVVWELLLPEPRHVVTQQLADSGGFGDPRSDPWALVEPEAHRAQARFEKAESLKAIHQSTEWCLRYRRTRKTRCLDAAVSSLARAVAIERGIANPYEPANDDAVDAERLQDALRAALPDSAYHYLVLFVRSVIADEMREMTPRDVDFIHRFSSSMSPFPSGEEWAPGSWFVEWLQEGYDDEAERVRRAREAGKLASLRQHESAQADPSSAATSTRPAYDGAEPLSAVPVVEARQTMYHPQGLGTSEETADHAGLVLVDLPTGPKWLEPAMAAACEAELERRRRHEAVRQQREQDKIEYYALIGKRYPD